MFVKVDFVGGEGMRVTQPRTVKRQARGRQRIADILDAALALFAENGYERTSTNAIAARAGMSPGSLYQFFPNKEAIADALSTHLVEQMRDAHSSAFDLARVTDLTLHELIDRMVDPLIAFNATHPGAKALLANTDMPAGAQGAARPLHEAVVDRVAAIIQARVPTLPATERDLAAMVSVRIVAAMMPPIVAAEGAERRALTAELKKALYGYLAPLDPDGS
ncbi:TetR/AcrR family transcriptional regulator [Plantactinospora mayteni]|uniref:TetR family transcriptional regulator n=1 Tax=Plantactinospora mayteni TaxID=566021 RepID=A0ABQ4EJD5_9ACTN|nr:TetR/AcrR family transcriptional regulator [Plantactinospora mayteni]GIG94322.1 TetR family transcriptional regulator [Plantactinospora mayteni]